MCSEHDTTLGQLAQDYNETVERISDALDVIKIMNNQLTYIELDELIS